MSFFREFLIGILIGTGMVIPGVSGSVIAVIFNVYDKLIYSITNLFKDFKNNMFFLIKFGTSILIGAIWFSNILMKLYSVNESITKTAFIGLILGGVPYLFKQVKEKGKKIDYKLLILSFFISLFLMLLSNKGDFTSSDNYSFICLFISGFVYSVGKVIPGISSSFLLIVIGMYNFVLSIISHPVTYGLKNLNYLIPFIMGFAIGSIILLKTISYLLKNKFEKTYSLIIGFVIGSIFVLFPDFNSIHSLIFQAIIVIVCYIFSYLLLKK